MIKLLLNNEDVLITNERNQILNQWNLFFEEYPLFRHFSALDIIDCRSIEEIPFCLNDMSEELNLLDNASLNYTFDRLTAFLKKQTSQFRHIFKYEYNELVNNFVPDRRIIRSLWKQKLKCLSDFDNTNLFALSKKMINSGFNPDLIYNQLIQVYKDFENGFHVENRGSQSLYVDRLGIPSVVLSFLNDFYSEKRIIKLAFNGYLLKDEGPSTVKELAIILETLFHLNIDIPEEVVCEKPKIFNDIFGPLAGRVDEENILSAEDFELRSWPDFKKYHNKKIKIFNEYYIIHIPKTRHELIFWGRRFHNCVGFQEKYIQHIQTNDALLFFLIKDNYPHYCVFYEDMISSDQSHFEAKGFANDELSLALINELELHAQRMYYKINFVNNLSYKLYENLSFFSKLSF